MKQNDRDTGLVSMVYKLLYFKNARLKIQAKCNVTIKRSASRAQAIKGKSVKVRERDMGAALV